MTTQQAENREAGTLSWFRVYFKGNSIFSLLIGFQAVKGFIFSPNSGQSVTAHTCDCVLDSHWSIATILASDWSRLIM